MRARLIGLAAVAALLALPASALASGPAWSVSATANSPTTTPTTSFTQGDGLAAFPGTGPDTYTLNVTNTGDSASSGTMTVTAQLGSGLTFVSRTANNWTCSGTTTTTCTRSDSLGAGQTYADPIVITATVSTTAGVNTQGGGDPAHVNLNMTASGGGATGTFSQTAITPIVGRPNLTSVDDVNSTFRQGDASDSYTITVVNQGLGATNSAGGTAPIVVSAALPSGEAAVSMSGSGWTCSLAAVSPLPANSCTRTDSWQGFALLPQITLVVSVAPNAITPETMATTVSGGGSVTATNTVNTSTTIQQSADLSESISHSGPFNQGDGASASDTYTLTTSNVIGPNSAVGGPTVGPVIVTDAPPLGQRITRLTGSGWTCSLAPVQLPGSPNVIVPADSCFRSDVLAVGSSYPAITATVAVDDDAQSPGMNQATVSGGGMSSASTANNEQSASDNVTVGQMPDLSPSVSHSGPFTQGDGAAQNDAYSITVNNVGFASTSGQVTVDDTLPADLTPGSPSGSGWSCTVTGQHVSCTDSTALSGGASGPTITIPVTVSNDAGSQLQNPVVVSGGNEIEPGNDSVVEQTFVTQLPDLTVDGSHTGDFHQGDSGDTYTLLVSNNNLAASTAPATLVDTIPAGLTATAISGTGWDCTLATLTCTRSDTLPPFGFYPPVTVTVDVAADAPASVTNSVAISGGGEIYLANDSSDDQTTIEPTLPVQHTLTVTLAGDGTGSVSGGGISCPGTCSKQLDAGTVVTLTANAADGSTFAGWSGACTGTGTCQVTMSADKAVTATFTKNPPPVTHTLTVTVAGTGSGTVTGSGISCPGTCTHSYQDGTVVTLNATAASGSTFAGWRGACTGTGPCLVTISTDRTVTASFAVVPTPPACTLVPGSSRVPLRSPRHHTGPKRGTITVTASCDQAVAASLRTTVTVHTPRTRHHAARTHVYKLKPVHRDLAARVAHTFTQHLPGAALTALAAGAKESVTFTLAATNANGSTTVTATIKRLEPSG